MSQKKIKRSFLASVRNYFFAGAVVLIPLGITIYITLFIVKISSKVLPKEINPNHYLPIDIPGLEILISLIFITFIGGLSLSFLGKKGVPFFQTSLVLVIKKRSAGKMSKSFEEN